MKRVVTAKWWVVSGEGWSVIGHDWPLTRGTGGKSPMVQGTGCLWSPWVLNVLQGTSGTGCREECLVTRGTVEEVAAGVSGHPHSPVSGNMKHAKQHPIHKHTNK